MIWVNDIVQGVLLGGLYALFACGLSLMFGVMKVINLAHGDLAVVAAYLAAGLVTVLHMPTALSILVSIPLFAIIGYVLWRTVLQASLNRSVLTTLLVTFGMSIVIENALQQFFSANSRSLSIGALATDHFNVGSQITVGYLDLAILIAAVVVLLGLQLFLSRTRQGRLIRAVADDREAAQLAGADYRHIFGIAAAIAFGTVAVAGTAYGVYTTFDPTTGTTQLLLLFAFEAVVIGGLGSLWGTLVGGILLGVVQDIGAQISTADLLLAGQLFFLLVLVIRPQGITGSRRTA